MRKANWRHTATGATEQNIIKMMGEEGSGERPQQVTEYSSQSHKTA